jgi:hypothetical protein
MMIEPRRPLERIRVLVLLFPSMAALSLRAIPGAHDPFEYLIAGTFATAVSLLAVFTFFVKGRL